MSSASAEGKRRIDTLRRQLARPIPVSVALPWLFLLLLSPVWLLYLARASGIVIAVIRSIVAPGSVSLHAVENDLIVFWPASQLVLTRHAAQLYDPAWFSAWRAIHFAPGVSSYLQYPYPPPALLILILIAPFGYFTGFLVWLPIIVVPGILLLRKVAVPWPILITALASTAGIYTVWIGQFGILAGALFIASLLLAGRRPVGSGALLGTLIIKPQAGLLGPVVLLARGEYRSLAFAVLATLALCALVTVLCGASVWPAFFLHGLKQAHRILIAPFPTEYELSGASVFWMARSFGTTVAVAAGAQIASALCAIGWCWIAWRRPENDRLALIALTTALTLLVTPYAYTDDMWGFSLMVGWLAWNRRRLELADVLMWMWPALCPIVAQALHAELTPLILLLGALRAWKRLAGIGTPAAACYPALL